MNAIGASILVVLVLAVLISPQRWALLAMMAGVLFLTQMQQVNVAGFNMFSIRFLELAGFFRVMARREFSFQHLNTVDHAFLLLNSYTTIVFLLRSTEGQANMIGGTMDGLLCYFTFRGLLTDMEDLHWFLRAFIFLLAPYMLLVVMESVTWHNPFSVLGAVDGGAFWSRHGRPRCFGSFRQPDTLGMFAASFIPLFVGMACVAKERARALIAISLCLIIVWAANAGGAAGAAVTGLACWGFWFVRMKMRKVRRGIVAFILLLTLLMKAPAWYIFSHVSNVTGGDGYHRSELIDAAYRHLGEWWFAGMSFIDTKDWLPYTLSVGSGADITNQYIAFGLTAGLGAIALFVLLLTRAFSNLGRALAVVRSGSQPSVESEFLLWGLGVMLVVHIIDWFGITYFDQMYMVWFMQLAAIATLSQACLARPAAAVEEDILKTEIEPEVEAPLKAES